MGPWVTSVSKQVASLRGEQDANLNADVSHGRTVICLVMSVSGCACTGSGPLRVCRISVRDKGVARRDTLLSLRGCSRLETQQEGTPNKAVLSPLVAVVFQISMLYFSSGSLKTFSLVQSFDVVSAIAVGL